MNTNLSEHIGATSVRPLFERPEWLRVRLDPRLPPNARELSETLMRTHALVLRQTPPKRAMLRCDVDESGTFSYKFASSPRAADVEHALLTDIADRLMELHRCRAFINSKQHEVEELPRFDFDSEFAHALEPRDGCMSQRSRIDVFRFLQDVEQLEQRVKCRDSESNRRIAHTLGQLARSGISRPMGLPPDDWAVRLDRMETQYPNFASVLQCVIRPHVSMLARGLRHRLAPILLIGGPGVGKTRFATALSAVLGVPPPLFVAIASETNGSSVAGSSSFWSNAAPGQLFESLAWGIGGHEPVANGLIVLDELDKASSVAYNPLGALYSLLEEHTASKFVDQALPDLVVDASHLSVIGTANDPELVPEALRSRMLEFQIPNPSPAQISTIAQEILKEIIAKFATPFDDQLPAGWALAVESMSPRAIKLALEIAHARAVTADRSRLAEEDWPKLESSQTTGRARRPIGFVAG